MPPTPYSLRVAWKKLQENERCEGMLPSGVRCIRKARLGDPPRWCWNCEPGPEAAARRRQAGAKRHPPGTPQAKTRDEAKKEGTLDEIVRDALTTSRRLTQQSRAIAARTSRGRPGWATPPQRCTGQRSRRSRRALRSGTSFRSPTGAPRRPRRLEGPRRRRKRAVSRAGSTRDGIFLE